MARPRVWVAALVTISTLLWAGCTGRDAQGWVAFVINQDEKSASGNSPGKSYTTAPARLASGGPGLVLEAGTGQEIEFKLEVPTSGGRAEVLGKTLSIKGGSLRLAGAGGGGGTLELEQGSLTLQTLSDGIGRGNFNARVKGHNPPWEVIGSFVAPCPLP